MSNVYQNKYISRATFKDHLFWIFLFLFSDPGGLIKANSGGKFYVNFGIFLVLTFLFFFTTGARECLRSNNIKRISLAIFIWALYYLLVYGLLNNDATNFYYFLKNGFLLPFIAICLFFYTYFFAVRNLTLFVKYLLVFSFIVFFLFFITYFTDLNLLPLRILDRGYVEQERILLYGYSIISISIMFAVNLFFFNLRIKERRWLILAAGIMLVLLIISLTRRLMLDILAYVIIAYILAVNLKFIKQIFPSRLITFLIIPLVILLLLFPGYLDATRQSAVESYSVLTEGESSSGQKDTRLSLRGQSFIMGKFLANPSFGTGFDPIWYSSEGDKQGYEAADYIFLGALAQHGILGLLIFLPIYILMYKALFSEYRELKYRRRVSYATEYDRMIIYYLVVTFLFKIIVYVNYFVEAGWATNSYSFYIGVGLLFAIRYRRVLSMQSLKPDNESYVQVQ